MLPCKQKFLSGMVFIIYKVTCFEFISVHGLFTSQEKLEGVNKPARRMGDANDPTNARFSHAGKKPLLAGYTMFEKTSFLLYCFQGKLGFLARTIPVFAP